MSRKHKHRADNRPASRRYIARSLARLQQHLDSTIIQAQPRPLDEFVKDGIGDWHRITRDRSSGTIVVDWGPMPGWSPDEGVVPPTIRAVG